MHVKKNTVDMPENEKPWPQVKILLFQRYGNKKENKEKDQYL